METPVQVGSWATESARGDYQDDDLHVPAFSSSSRPSDPLAALAPPVGPHLKVGAHNLSDFTTNFCWFKTELQFLKIQLN